MTQTSSNMGRRSFLKATAACLVLPATTQAQPSHGTLLDVREVDGAPTYNGLTPGPTLRIDPGETLDITLTNNLPALHDDCTLDPNAFHGLNTTNLHVHGLHVSPNVDSSGQFDADNVFLSVVPQDQIVACAEVCGEDTGTTFRRHQTLYRFETADSHPSGTFWCHSHEHGATAQQVGAGLSGPLIIRDRPGRMPAYIEQAEEKVLMIMNRGLVEVRAEGGGRVISAITLHPGAVQRWRIINAKGPGASFAHLRTGLDTLEMHQIAFDGLTLDLRVPVDQDNTDAPWLNPAALAPGNRMDVMIRVPADTRPGTYRASAGQGIAGLIGATVMEDIQIDIIVAGEASEALWSDDPTLPGSGMIPFDDTPLAPRTIRFTPGFTVDGAEYSGDTQQQMALGTHEEWTISNSTGGVHAFHIHVNAFFITHINCVKLAEDDPLRRWQDTIGLPTGSANEPGTVTYKTRFETYTGRFVIHCHVLRHEDLGMMQAVEVV